MTTTESGLKATRLHTADDLMRICRRGVRGELVRGVLHETMPAGQEHGEIAARLAAELLVFSRARKLGRVATSDAGVWLERDPDTVREPDVAFTSAARMPLDVRVTGYAEAVPDLVAEIVSPGESRRWARDRARMWLDHGVRLVWVVHPDTRTVDVYRPGAVVATRNEDDPLDGLDVLPGFSCPVSAVFGP